MLSGKQNEDEMLVAQKINDYITAKRPDAVCDLCIVSGLGLTRQAHAAQITGALGTTTDFERGKELCSACGEVRVVINAQ